MSKISKEEKSTISKKLLQIKVAGLESYLGYLNKELANSEDNDIRKAYVKYLKKEIKRAEKKIAKGNAKLGIVGEN
ncbi:MAG: hypothetical protein ACPGU4_10470 [Flavobacteriales bacterium]